MKETLIEMLESSKKFHANKLKELSYKNKDFEKEAYALFSELFKKEEEIEEYYILKHGDDIHGLDGGCTHDIHVLYQAHWKRFNELKKKHGLSDDDLREK